MKYLISVLFLLFGFKIFPQALVEDQIFATKFRENVYLENSLITRIKKDGRQTVHIIEYNKDNKVTRELSRIDDSLFLYTEYYPLSFDHFILNHGNYGIIKQGKLIISDEIKLDSTVLYDYDTYEAFQIPTERQVLKPIGDWVEKYPFSYVKTKGSFNEKGKDGKWKFYTSTIDVQKIRIYKDNLLIDEEFTDILLNKSMLRSKKSDPT